MKPTILLPMTLLVFGEFVSCQDDSSGSNSNAGGSSAEAGAGGAQSSSTTPGGSANDSEGGSTNAATAGASAGGNGGAATTDPSGFVIRTPTTRSVDCDGTATDFADNDWLCTFAYGDTTGTVYVQSNATGCTIIMSSTPVYTTVLAQIAIDGTVTALESASYDWGGNHHNDMLTFTYDGTTYAYYHSSFGYGWRSCQNMDCLQVFDSSGTVTDDGCTSARTLPIVCSQIQASGNYASLTEDTFAKCIGDSSA